jgi:hypothetical protein
VAHFRRSLSLAPTRGSTKLQGTNLTLQVASFKPSIVPIEDQTIPRAIPFRLAVSASDPDLPSQTLRYHLLNSPHRPNRYQRRHHLDSAATDPITNNFTVIVIDNGTPALSASQSFTVRLIDADSSVVLSLKPGTPDSRSSTLTFSGTPGLSYVAQYTTNLPGLWLDFATNTAATDGLWSALDPSATNRARFYRARSSGSR